MSRRYFELLAEHGLLHADLSPDAAYAFLALLEGFLMAGANTPESDLRYGLTCSRSPSGEPSKPDGHFPRPRGNPSRRASSPFSAAWSKPTTPPDQRAADTTTNGGRGNVNTDPKRDPVKSVSNRLFLKISGRRLRAYSIVLHTGRASGREYRNPVSAYPLGDGFVIAVLYGVQSQWVRNVLASGRLTLRTKGREYALVGPEIIPPEQGLAAFPPWQRWMLKARKIQDFVWAHQVVGVS
jgi:hypothetical protein